MGRGALRPEVSNYENSETRRHQDRRSCDPEMGRNRYGIVPELRRGGAGANSAPLSYLRSSRLLPVRASDAFAGLQIVIFIPFPNVKAHGSKRHR